MKKSMKKILANVDTKSIINAYQGIKVGPISATPNRFVPFESKSFEFICHPAGSYRIPLSILAKK